jgi:HEPN domain-containing protein
MTSPLRLIRGQTPQFLFLFNNADQFYISARRAFLYAWGAVGCCNAHQSIELYIKAILKLRHEAGRGHDLSRLLQKYETRDPYFSTILKDSHKVEFLTELSDAYLSHRYGETGIALDTEKTIALLDELAFNLRNIYLRNLNFSSRKIYIPNKLKEEFLSNNTHFTENDLTNHPLAQLGLPVD